MHVNAPVIAAQFSKDRFKSFWTKTLFRSSQYSSHSSVVMSTTTSGACSRICAFKSYSYVYVFQRHKHEPAAYTDTFVSITFNTL